VTGSVTSADDNEPIVGATVVAKGTSVGTVTDFDGNFSFEVPSSAATLVISYVGKTPQEVKIAPNVRVALVSSAEALEEVIVVAYGTATKRSFTGSALQVDGEKISRKSTSELSKALQGEIPGVQVFNTSGQPGTNATVRIRGIGSVNSNNAPLYVVDGIAYGADLSAINPSDIESTTVLKDATATALYGSRAANGVILVTTKKGKSGVTRVEAEVNYGIAERLIPLYSTIKSPERYAELTWEGIRNRRIYSNGDSEAAAAEYANNNLFGSVGFDPGYNMWKADGNALINPATGKFNEGIQRKYTPEKWEDYIFNTGEKRSGDVRISGGSDKVTYFNSLGYYKEKGYYIESDFERFAARSNVSANLTEWLKSTLNMTYSRMATNNPGQTDNMNNGFQFVNFMPSLFPVFYHDADGNLEKDDKVGGYRYDYGNDPYARTYGGGINPAGAIQLDKRQTEYNLFSGNYLVEARFLKDFKLTANLGVQYMGYKTNDLTNPYYGDAEGLGRIRKTETTYRNVTFNQILSYSKKLGSHNIDAFVAHETYDMENKFLDGQKSLLVRPTNMEWANAVIMGYMDSDTYGYSMESYFGQVRYDYDEKYHFNASLRGDGSSRFAAGNRWGTFGSVGAAWVVSRESFLESADWLKNLKYKISWGLLGNQDINTGTSRANYYPYEDLFSISNMNDKPSFEFVYKGNKDLTWESSSTFNTGLEFDINNWLEGEVEYFHRTTTDMLFLKRVAPSLGYAFYPVNDGEMVNQGVEFNLTGHVVNTNDIKLDIRVNGGHYKNEITKMPFDDTTGKPKPVELQGAYAWAEGHSYYSFYMREYAGVDPETGVGQFNQYVNVKSDGTEDIITEMEGYMSKNTIEKLEVRKTANFSEATQKFVDKTADPLLTGGFGFDLDVKGFSFSTTFTYGIGGYAIDYVYATLMGNPLAGAYNWHTDIENRWTKPGDQTDVPRLSRNLDTYASSTSTRYLTDRTYLNLTNARIGYTFPKSILNHIKLDGLSVYVTGENLLLLSARKGFVSMASVNGESARSQYVPVSAITGGIKVNF
jgi:TonB-linked SusC/RagA family outer membrane protein